MTKNDKILVIDDLIKTTFSIYQLQDSLLSSLEKTICKEKTEYIQESYKIIFEFLLANNFIKESTSSPKFKFTKEWGELCEIGSLEQFLLNLKGKEDYEVSLKERSKEIAEDSLQLSKDANKISVDANGISKNAKNISFWSLIIATGALVFSIFSSDQKKIKELDIKINSIKNETILLNQQHLEEHKVYIKYIDSLYTEINKLQKNKFTNER